MNHKIKNTSILIIPQWATKSALDKNFNASASSINPRETLIVFNHPPDFNFVGIFWQDGVAGSVGFLFMNQGLIMRFMACKSVNEGRKAAAFNVLVLLPISTVVVSNAGWIGKAISIVIPIAITGITVLSIPVANPLIITVAAPVCDDSDTCLVGLYSYEV